MGNCLAGIGANPTTIDVLGDKLAEDFEIIKVSNRSNILLRILDMWWTIIVNRKKVDVILIDTYSTLAFHFAWTSASWAHLFKIPYIPFIHGGDFSRRIEISPKLVNKFLKYADRIITPSGYLKEKISPLVSGKTVVIPNFLDLKQYPYEKHSSIERVKMLWVRALADIYNPKMAIDVLNILHSKGIKEATLTMVGPDKDNMKESLLDYAQNKGLSKAISLVGRLTKKEWLAMAKDFDCFINTTSVDNTPISVMEAMALGLPVISTDVGGIPFIIDNRVDGLLVSVGDVNGMADAICLLKEKASLYNDISQTARNKASEWDWEVIKMKWYDLFSRYSL